MVKLRMARSQTLFFALFFRESWKPFVDGKEFVDPLDGFFADAAEKVFFRQIWRSGFDEVPPCMCPAEGMRMARYFLVAGVAVCLQDAVESLEEIFCVTAAAAGLVLVEADGVRSSSGSVMRRSSCENFARSSAVWSFCFLRR